MEEEGRRKKEEPRNKKTTVLTCNTLYSHSGQPFLLPLARHAFCSEPIRPSFYIPHFFRLYQSPYCIMKPD